MSNNQHEDRKAHPGWLIYSIAVVFCAVVISKTGGAFEANLPVIVCYILMIFFGATAGILEVKIWWAGAIAGGISGIGSVFLLSCLLESGVEFNDLIFLTVIFLGMAPGIFFYLVIEEFWGMRGKPNSPEPNSPTWMGTPFGRKRRLKIIFILLFAIIVVFVVFLNF